MDSMIDIFVDPPDWGGGFIVVTNVAHQLAGEILYRSEDTSGNNVTLNLREPNFDLVKPAGVGRGIVDPNRGVSLKKFKDFLGLVRTQIVGNSWISRPAGWLSTIWARKSTNSELV